MLTFAKRRDRVRAEVIGKLIDFGLRPARGVSKEAFEARLDRLAVALVYLEPKDFRAAIVAIRGAATGPNRDVWPTDAVIFNQVRPFCRHIGVSKMVASYMRSEAGRAAWQRQPVEAHSLFRFMRASGRVPGVQDWDRIKADARGLLDRIAAADRDQYADELSLRQDAEQLLSFWKKQKRWLSELIFHDFEGPYEPAMKAAVGMVEDALQAEAWQ